jgi:hypothetical protein
MALNTTGIFEVDIGHGSASDSLNAGFFAPNGSGAGTDYSIQSPIACTDLVIDGSDNTKVSSSSIGFTLAHQRNGLRITTGTGFTTGLYEIVSVSAGVATLDRACGTAGSTGGTARVGGPLASPGGAMALGTAVGQTVFLRYAASSYDCGSSANAAGGRVNLTTNKPTTFIGYDATRTLTNTDANRPLMRATANSMALVTAPLQSIVRNVRFGRSASETGVTGYTDTGGVSGGIVERCQANSIATGFTHAQGGRISTLCEAVSCTNGFNKTATSSVVFLGDVARNCTTNGFLLSGAYGSLIWCQATECGTGFLFQANYYTVLLCTAYKSANNGFDWSNQYITWIADCLATENGTSSTGYGFAMGVGVDPYSFMRNCAGHGNASGNLDANMTTLAEGFVALSADPFTNAAGLDFSLNSTAGGGALLKGAGWPSTFPGLAGTSYPDIGAYQTAAGSGGTTYFLF